MSDGNVVKLEAVPDAIERIMERLQNLEAEVSMLRRVALADADELPPDEWRLVDDLDRGAQHAVLFGYEGEGDSLEFKRLADVIGHESGYAYYFKVSIEGNGAKYGTVVMYGHEDDAPHDMEACKKLVKGIFAGTIPDPRRPVHKRRP